MQLVVRVANHCALVRTKVENMQANHLAALKSVFKSFQFNHTKEWERLSYFVCFFFISMKERGVFVCSFQEAVVLMY